jgi:hypothetical protein
VTAKFATQLVAPDTQCRAAHPVGEHLAQQYPHHRPPRHREGDNVQVGGHLAGHRGRMAEDRVSAGADACCSEDDADNGQGDRHAGGAREQQRFAARAVDERDRGNRGQNVDEAGQKVDPQGPLLRRPRRFPQDLAYPPSPIANSGPFIDQSAP